MKIAFVIDHLRADGTQKMLWQLTKRLVPRGHEITIICLNDSWDDVLVKRLREIPVEVEIIGKRALLTGIGFPRLWCLLRNRKFQAVVTMLFVADVLGRLLARASGVARVITSLRARNVNYNLLQRSLVRLTMRCVDCVVINSVNIRDFTMQYEGAPSDKIHTISNGVDVDLFAMPVDQCRVRSELGLAKSGTLLVTAGRLTQQKGIDVLLEALALVAVENLHLVIMGVGEAESSLRALTKRLNLDARVFFVGYRHDLPKLLGAFDLYVHPARFEGMPNALLEAMAAARPIVATNVDGNRDLIENGIHGWLVAPEDPAEMAKAITDAITNPDEAQRRGIAAYRRVIEHFSVDAMVTAWENVLLGRQLLR